MEPTYEVVGDVERFDERDTVFAREALDPDSPEGLAYYTDHPHLRIADRQLRRFIEDKLDRSRFTWGRASYQTVFSALAHLGLPDCVAGEPVPGRLDIAPERGSVVIKYLARYLGADLVGIAALKPEWVYSHRGARPFFGGQAPNPPLFEGMPEDYTGGSWGDPIELAHPNAIALAFSQDLDMLRTGPGVASDLEVGRVYARSALVACQVASFIRSLGYEARAHHIRNYCVMAVPVAVDAGSVSYTHLRAHET